MNGWYRLWIFVSALYALAIIAVTYFSLPSDSAVSAAEILTHVSDRSLELAHNDGKELQWKDIVLNGQHVSVPTKLDPTSERDFAQDYLQAQRLALRDKQITLSMLAFAWWVVPCVLSLAIGLGIAWVRHGFRREAP